MKIEDCFSRYVESHLRGRYVTLNHIDLLLKKYSNIHEITILGTSELGKNIPMIKIGNGKKKVLAWSQMHGNESTTTKAIFDFLNLLQENELFKDEISNFHKNFTLYLIPILNPDGAALYTRINANSIDLNRDSQDLSQKESKILYQVFHDIQPDLCLNLHGQRTIFGLDNGLPATVSFLSPAANKERNITPSRETGMQLIDKMNKVLQNKISGQVGRYDDAYNENCFGDYFQKNEVPVILFEAGHMQGDYLREKTREYIFYALLTLFEFIETPSGSIDGYLSIPENKKNFVDILIKDVIIGDLKNKVDFAIQYKEELVDNKLCFIPKLVNIGDLSSFNGHFTIDMNGESVLLNSQQRVNIEDEILTINKKNNDLLINFSEKDFHPNNIS